MGVHRASQLDQITDPLARFMALKPLPWFGRRLSFPIFVVHGPLGQLFYKKVIATKLFGAPMHVIAGPKFFYAYLAIVVASAWVLQKTFLGSKKVGSLSKNIVGRLASRL